MEPVALAVGVAAGLLLVPGGVRAFREAGWTRENHAGRAVAFPAGALAMAAGIVAIGACAALDAVADTEILVNQPNYLVLFGALDRVGEVLVPAAAVQAAVLVLGVAFLGLVDDVLDAPGRGWRGHARAVGRGDLSTGALKAIGTLALATFVLAGGEDWAVSVLLVALTTNLFNLLDLRPGRAWKALLVVGAGLLVAGHSEPLRALGAWLGPLLVLGVFDLREKAMLGDTGSNAMGALMGLWLVLALDGTGELAALAAVLALTVYGELLSFTRTIERVPPLRWLDDLGRPRVAGTSDTPDRFRPGSS